MAITQPEITRLVSAMDVSYRDLEPFRRHTLDAVRQYCGRHYGKNDEEIARVPVNFLQFAIATYVQKIAANIPKWLIRTEHTGLAETAERLGLALNKTAKEIKVQDELECAVTNSMFNLGIVKIASETLDRGMIADATQPYVESIDLPNFVYDTDASSMTMCQFMGHKFRMDREVFENCGLYENTDQIPSTTERGGAKGSEYRTSEMIHTDGNETYRDQVELWAMFLPFENIILTISSDGAGTKCREQQWEGGELGPYRFLSFNKVPGNIMPLAPSALWIDLHEMANGLFRKVKDQADRQKTVTAFRASAKDDARRIRDTGDGGTVLVSDPDGVREHSFGGADPNTAATFMATKDLFNYASGNVEMLAGLGAQSDTASQDAMLGQAAGSRVEDMHQKYLGFCKEVGEAIADELWNDPLIDIPLTKRVPNFGIRIPTRFSADTLEGDFLDYNFSVDPFSTTHQSPGQRLNTMAMLLERFVAPMLPMFQEQGGQIDMQRLLGMAGEYSGMDEFQNIYTFGENDGGGSEPVMPSGEQKTTREYIRRSVSTGGTQRHRDNQLAQAFLGQNSQPNERGAVMRPGA